MLLSDEFKRWEDERVKRMQKRMTENIIGPIIDKLIKTGALSKPDCRYEITWPGYGISAK